MEQDIREVLNKCTVCKKYTSTPTPKIPPNAVADPELFKIWGLDVIGPFPTAKTGQHFAIVAIDFATRWPISWATKDHTADTVN